MAVLVLVLFLSGLAAFVVIVPVAERAPPPAGFVPFRDDALAARFRPRLDCPADFGAIEAVYYRAAWDDAGLIHLAYHPAWARERNEAPGFGPFLSRTLYTGGLSLQRAMFGKGDIESIGLKVDPVSWSILEVEYETAKDYDPSAFSVTHENVVAKGPLVPPLAFKVVSWNHLFSLEKGGSPASLSGSSRPEPLLYFSAALWSGYAMWKNPETRLRKDRAHFDWERGAVE